MTVETSRAFKKGYALARLRDIWYTLCPTKQVDGLDLEVTLAWPNVLEKIICEVWPGVHSTVRCWHCMYPLSTLWDYGIVKDDWIAGLHMSLKDFPPWQDEFSTMSAEIKRTFTCAARILSHLSLMTWCKCAGVKGYQWFLLDLWTFLFRYRVVLSGSGSRRLRSSALEKCWEFVWLQRWKTRDVATSSLMCSCFYDILWHSVIFYSMMFYDIAWYRMIFYDLQWYSMVSYDILWYPRIFYDILWYSMIFLIDVLPEVFSFFR